MCQDFAESDMAFQRTSQRRIFCAAPAQDELKTLLLAKVHSREDKSPIGVGDAGGGEFCRSRNDVFIAQAQFAAFRNYNTDKVHSELFASCRFGREFFEKRMLHQASEEHLRHFSSGGECSTSVVAEFALSQ